MGLALTPRGRTDVPDLHNPNHAPTPAREDHCATGRGWTSLWIAASALTGVLALLAGLAGGAGVADVLVAAAFGALLLGSAAGVVLGSRAGFYLALLASSVLIVVGVLLALVAPVANLAWAGVGLAGFLSFHYFSGRSECFR